MVPNYSWWEGPFYGVDLKVYDALAGKLGLEKSTILSREMVLEKMPTLEPRDLKGGVIYYDGQFDDAKLAVTHRRRWSVFTSILKTRMVYGTNVNAAP